MVLTFDDRVSVSGTTVNLDGVPVPNVSLWLRGDGAEQVSQAPEYPSWEERFEERIFSSDHRGYFEVRGLTSDVVSIVPVQSDVRLYVGKSPVYFAQVPSGDNLIPVAFAAAYDLRVVSSKDGVPIPQPWRVTIEGAAPIMASAIERVAGRVRLHLPIDQYPEGSTVSLLLGGPGFAPQVRELRLQVGAVVDVPVDPEPDAGEAGAIELALPAGFVPPKGWASIALAPRSVGGEQISRQIEHADGKWVVTHVPQGEYDVLYMDQLIASGVQVYDGGVQRVAAETSGFLGLRLLPTRDGRALRGAFNVDILYASSISTVMGSWTVETDERGHLPMGSYPASGRIKLLQVMRSTDRLREPVEVIFSPIDGAGVERFVEVKLVGWD